MSNTRLADEYADIAKRLKELEAEKLAALNTPDPDSVTLGEVYDAWKPAPGYAGEAAAGYPYGSADADYVC